MLLKYNTSWIVSLLWQSYESCGSFYESLIIFMSFDVCKIIYDKFTLLPFLIKLHIWRQVRFQLFIRRFQLYIRINHFFKICRILQTSLNIHQLTLNLKSVFNLASILVFVFCFGRNCGFFLTDFPGKLLGK